MEGMEKFCIARFSPFQGLLQQKMFGTFILWKSLDEPKNWKKLCRSKLHFKQVIAVDIVSNETMVFLLGLFKQEKFFLGHPVSAAVLGSKLIILHLENKKPMKKLLVLRWPKFHVKLRKF